MRTHPSSSLRSLLLTHFTLLAVWAGAQTITAPDVIQPMGTAYDMYYIASTIPWDTLPGSNVLWDYSSMTVDPTDGTTFQTIDPAQAPQIADYPTANHVVRSFVTSDSSYVTHIYYHVDATRSLALGSVSPDFTFVFDQPGLDQAFPMQLGDTVAAPYCDLSDGFGSQYHFCGHQREIFDASGTLILPYGTFHNVKHTIHWSSSLETTGGTTDSTYFIQRYWFVPGVAYPVLQTDMFINSLGQISFFGGRLMDASAFTGIANVVADLDWSLYPLPAQDALTVARTLSGPARLELLSMDGRLLQQAALRADEQSLAMDLGGLADGGYLLRITTARGRITRHVMKAGAR